jgi:hypothetical protein
MGRMPQKVAAQIPQQVIRQDIGMALHQVEANDRTDRHGQATRNEQVQIDGC